MNKVFAAASGIFFNAAAGFYLLMVPGEQMSGFVYWVLLIAIALAAILSILSFGILTLGWAGMMSYEETSDHQPGSKRAIEMYEVTISSLAGYSRTRFYTSFAASLLLMAGIAAQGWVFVLVLEVLGSALGYGFIHWVMNNVAEMHKRAYGSDDS
jgi:hypothetical protein